MNRSGFSLIEIMVGMLIFAVGFMALSASTAFVSAQIQAADVRTERNVAYQQVSEQLHALPFDSVKTHSSPQAVGSYALTWDVQSVNWALKQVRLVSTGPGFEGGRRVASATDTLTIRIARPIQ
jgi:prepilin-type N-terminal cleavage/methylation domain-containing protein